MTVRQHGSDTESSQIPSVEDVGSAAWTAAILRTLANAGGQALTLRDLENSVGEMVPAIGTPPVEHEVNLLMRYRFVERDSGRAAVRLTSEGVALANDFSHVDQTPS